MKNIMLLMTVCVLWHSTFSQSQAGLEQYIYMDTKPVTTTPVIWYQSEQGWNAEARYNYDAANTLSIYAGKTFSKSSVVSYSVSALAGILLGEYKGISLAVNTDLDYKNMSLSLQSQYTISSRDCTTNFIYNWCDLGYKVSSVFTTGVSMQQTNVAKTKAVSEKGVYVKAAFGRWAFPLYVYNPLDNGRYGIMGLNFTWQYKKNIKHSVNYL